VALRIMVGRMISAELRLLRIKAIHSSLLSADLIKG